MNYGTLAKMKKEFDTYTNANKQHIIYNFNMLNASVKPSAFSILKL